jgi:hypothetical protein
MIALAKYSIGVGDRFAHQAKAQLQACLRAEKYGLIVVPVWNKSNREHTIIGTEPAAVRAAADAAVKELKWERPYHVDADHIRLETVDRFLPASDFYTIDVADSIGHPADPAAVAAFVDKHTSITGTLVIPGIDEAFTTTRDDIERIAWKYLKAVQDAGAIYRKIAATKGVGNFITEVSMDETDSPQTPPELLVILAALAAEGVPVQTIAPKFTGRFNKGVDYVGDVAQFEKEFRQDLAVIAFAVAKFGLPANLKLSVHSGSDKFSIYAPIQRAIREFKAGLHLKTAGTTWLEEVIGLAERNGHRHRRCQTPHRRCGAGLDIGAVRGSPPAQSFRPGLQSAPAAVDPRRLQGGREDGRPVSGVAEALRRNDRSQRDREFVRPAYRAIVSRSVMTAIRNLTQSRKAAKIRQNQD